MVGVGPDYKTSMKYIVGQTTRFGYIESITRRPGDEKWIDVHTYNQEEKSITLWKWWNSDVVPLHFEADQDF